MLSNLINYVSTVNKFKLSIVEIAACLVYKNTEEKALSEAFELKKLINSNNNKFKILCKNNTNLLNDSDLKEIKEKINYYKIVDQHTDNYIKLVYKYTKNKSSVELHQYYKSSESFLLSLKEILK